MSYLARIYWNNAFREGKGPLQLLSRACDAKHVLLAIESNEKVIKTEVCGKNNFYVDIETTEIESSMWNRQKDLNGYKLLDIKAVPQDKLNNMTVEGINAYKSKYLKDAYKLFGLKKNQLYIIGFKDCQSYVDFVWKEIFGEYPKNRLQQGLHASGSGALGSSGLVSSGLASGVGAPVLLGSGLGGLVLGGILGGSSAAKKVPQKR